MSVEFRGDKILAALQKGVQLRVEFRGDKILAALQKVVQWRFEFRGDKILAALQKRCSVAGEINFSFTLNSRCYLCGYFGT